MAKKQPQPKKSTADQSLKLPVLIELVFTLSKLTVVLVGVIVMVLTFANGNPYWVAMLRGGVTVFGLGLIVYFTSWVVSKGVIDSARSMLKKQMILIGFHLAIQWILMHDIYSRR